MMATCPSETKNAEINPQKITEMYETVLNHRYKGKLKNTDKDTKPYDYGNWKNAQKTHLVYKIDNEPPIMITNIPKYPKDSKDSKDSEDSKDSKDSEDSKDSKDSDGKHAEKQLIEELNKKGKEKKTNGSSSPDSKVTDLFARMSVNPITITIYINNSPCSQSPHECTSKLIEYLDSNVNVHLRLYVASLYNICRESCKEEYHNEHITPTKHEANYRGLRNLMQHGRCEIMAFTEDIWKQLFEMTTGSDQLPDDYDNMKDGNDRSRKDEDERIQTDLNHIRNNEL